MSGIASPRSSKAVPVALRTAILWVAVWPCAAPALDVEALLRRPGADLSAVAMTVAEQGWPTARELRQLAVAGPPDIVPAAMRAWGEARWKMLETPTTGALFAAEEPAALAAWETLVAERGASALAVAAALSETPGFRARAMRLLPVLLGAVSTTDVAAWIASRAMADEAPRLVGLLTEAANWLRDGSMQARVVEVLLLLWRYDEAVRVAEHAFTGSSGDVFVRLAATALRRSGSDEALRTAFDRLHRGRVDRAGRERELLFWLRTAAQLGWADPLRGRLRPPDLLQLPPQDAAQAVQELARLGLAAEASRLLSSGQAPFQIYLRAWARRAAGDASGADEDLAALEAMFGTDGELLKGDALATADVMERLGDTAAAVRLWKRVIDSPPKGTLHDVNAHVQLARIAELSGDLNAALAHCEQALRISQSLDSTTLTGPGGQRGTEWLMRAILELRRRLSAGTGAAP